MCITKVLNVKGPVMFHGTIRTYRNTQEWNSSISFCLRSQSTGMITAVNINILTKVAKTLITIKCVNNGSNTVCVSLLPTSGSLP
jgi:hypothetical protein